jgi:hypothetical protein
MWFPTSFFFNDFDQEGSFISRQFTSPWDLDSFQRHAIEIFMSCFIFLCADSESMWEIVHRDDRSP